MASRGGRSSPVELVSAWLVVLSDPVSSPAVVSDEPASVVAVPPLVVAEPAVVVDVSWPVLAGSWGVVVELELASPSCGVSSLSALHAAAANARTSRRCWEDVRGRCIGELR